MAVPAKVLPFDSNDLNDRRRKTGPGVPGQRGWPTVGAYECELRVVVRVKVLSYRNLWRVQGSRGSD